MNSKYGKSPPDSGIMRPHSAYDRPPANATNEPNVQTIIAIPGDPAYLRIWPPLANNPVPMIELMNSSEEMVGLKIRRFVAQLNNVPNNQGDCSC